VWAFIAPFILIVAINLALFVRIIYAVMQMKRGVQGRRSSKEDIDRYRGLRKGLRASLSFLSLLGLTWIFGALAIGEAAVVFFYLFALGNVFQGVLIFVFHCLLDPKFVSGRIIAQTHRFCSIRALWRRLKGIDSSASHHSSASDGEGMRGKTLRTLRKPQAATAYRRANTPSTEDEVLVEIQDPNERPGGTTFMAGGRTYSIERRPQASTASTEEAISDSSHTEQPFMEQTSTLQELVSESNC
jgi:hypothetical protein